MAAVLAHIRTCRATPCRMSARLAAASTMLHSRAAAVRLPVCAHATARRTETKSKRARL